MGKQVRLFWIGIIIGMMFLGFATDSKAAKHESEFYTSKKGNTYYYDEDGDKVSDGLYDIAGKTYYFDDKGIMFTGWKKIKKNYYYFDRKKGMMRKNKKVDGIILKKDGKAKKNKRAVEKIKVMMQARKIVQTQTKYSDSKAEKLEKCFRWIFPFPYNQHRKLDKIYKKKGWEVEFANDIFKRKSGCCVADASVFAFLAKEIGYKNVYIGHDTGHAWTEINGKVYDPLFAEARGFKKYYGVSYKSYGLHAVEKRKV